MKRDSIATAIGSISAAAALFSLSSQSCGTNGVGTGGTGGVLNTDIAIVAPVTGSCVTAVMGDEPYVPISVSLTNIQLAPPGVCSQQLTTVTTVGTGFGGQGGSGGSSGFALPCGHLSLFACSQATAKQNDGHCPLTTAPNNESSGTTIDLLAARYGQLFDPDPTGPVPDPRTDEARLVHVDLLVTREARNIFDLVDAEIPIAKQLDDLRILPPGYACPDGTGGMGGAGAH